MLSLPQASDARAARPARPHAAQLTRAQRLALYRHMRMTRTLEERLVALYRQTKVVGGLFRSLGQEADAVGSAFALERRDIMSPLIRNMGSMLVKGATPLEILRQYMAKGDSPTRGRELNIHFGDLVRGFVGQISHLGDMIPVMAGIALSFRMRGEDRVVDPFKIHEKTRLRLTDEEAARVNAELQRFSALRPSSPGREG